MAHAAILTTDRVEGMAVWLCGNPGLERGIFAVPHESGIGSMRSVSAILLRMSCWQVACVVTRGNMIMQQKLAFHQFANALGGYRAKVDNDFEVVHMESGRVIQVLSESAYAAHSINNPLADVLIVVTAQVPSHFVQCGKKSIFEVDKEEEEGEEKEEKHLKKVAAAGKAVIAVRLPARRWWFHVEGADGVVINGYNGTWDVERQLARQDLAAWMDLLNPQLRIHFAHDWQATSATGTRSFRVDDVSSFDAPLPKLFYKTKGHSAPDYGLNSPTATASASSSSRSNDTATSSITTSSPAMTTLTATSPALVTEAT